MKPLLRTIIIIFTPFLVVILVNEYYRQVNTQPSIQRYGIQALNASARVPDRCTWACHDETRWCTKHHISIMKPLQHWLDPVYYGMISGLKEAGNYKTVNVIFLAMIWPAFMFYLFISILNMQRRIRKLKRT